LALYLSILPATATVIAAIMLAQIPARQDLAGIAFVMIAIAIHKPPGSAADAGRMGNKKESNRPTMRSGQQKDDAAG